MLPILSKANNAVLVPDAPAVQNLFPNAQTLDVEGFSMAVLPHNLHTYLLLKHMGTTIPNPMLYHYDWNSGTPYQVQRATCDLLTTHPRAYVLNDLGTGKTKAVLWAWDYLNKQKLAGKLLVTCPISTMNFVWGREIFATLPGRKVQVLYGDREQRLKRLNEDADIYIINHDGVKVIRKELEARTDIDTLALDELAVYRNNSDRSKIMRKLAQRFQWIWGMTGEPMPNAPTDVWSQAQIVNPTLVPKTFGATRELLMTKKSQYKFIPKADAVDTAFRMMQPAVRFNLDDVVELPDVTHRHIDVPLSDEQQDTYNKLVREFAAMVDEKVITAANAGAAMNKLLQVACGWVYTNAPEYVGLNPVPRVSTLVDLVMGAAQKVLVFVPYRHAVEEISKVFLHKDVAIHHAVVHGDVSQKDRDHEFNMFQNTGKYKALLAHPQCLAHGLTLTAASTIIWYSPTASLEIYDQANARIRRIGQKNKQQILHLQGSPVERKIYNLLRSKHKVQDALLTLFEEATERRMT